MEAGGNRGGRIQNDEIKKNSPPATRMSGNVRNLEYLVNLWLIFPWRIFQKPTHKHINKARLDGGVRGRNAGSPANQQPRRGLVPSIRGEEQRRRPLVVGGRDIGSPIDEQ